LFETQGWALGRAGYWVLGAARSQITVRIVDPHKDDALADVLMKSLGLTGVLVVVAIVAGLVMAGVLFYIRSRKPLDH
jgi:cell division protein FtsW (lipid II flippase)